MVGGFDAGIEGTHHIDTAVPRDGDNRLEGTEINTYSTRINVSQVLNVSAALLPNPRQLGEQAMRGIWIAAGLRLVGANSPTTLIVSAVTDSFPWESDTFFS